MNLPGIKCCGETHTGAFCPTCGIELGGPMKAFAEMLRWVHQRVVETRRNLRGLMIDLEQGAVRYPGRPSIDREIALTESTLKKWERWEKAIKDLLAAQKGGDTCP